MRVNRARGWQAALVLLWLPASAFASTVSGVVLDSQHLPVPRAQVVAACTEGREQGETDAQGRFAIGVPPGERCVVSVSRDGFAPFQLVLRDPAAPLTIRLRIAAIAEHLTVEAKAPAFAGRVLLRSDETDFRALAGSTNELIQYARRLSGTFSRAPVIYVDGLPADTPPPLELISQISVGGDLFSVEYGDGESATIEIVTKSPARTLRVFSGGDIPTIGARNVLSSGEGEKSRSINVGAMGPVPGTPLTFSATANVFRSSQDAPILVQLPELAAPEATAEIRHRSASGFLSVFFARDPSLRLRGSVRESRSGGANGGVGGITFQEAGVGSSSIAREIRGTATKAWADVQYEGGASVNYTRSDTSANSAERGISIGGDAVMGGSSTLESSRRALRWTSKHVVRSSASRRWIVGIVARGGAESHRRRPNPEGAFYFADLEAYRAALAGKPTGTWFVDRADGFPRVVALTAAPFAEMELVRAKPFSVSAGLRADYRSDFGTLLSPRVSAAAQWRGTTVRAGVGLFARDLPQTILLTVMERNGRDLQQFVATEVSLVNPNESLLRGLGTVRSRLADDLTRPRAAVWRVSAERTIAGVTAALEYDVADERHLPGSDRLAVESGWVDLLESNRRALRQRLHVHAGRKWRQQQLTVDYDFTRARDDSDGPFSFPERPGDLAAEWARSAGVSPHEVTIMASLSLPAAVSINVADVWRSGAPFNITTAFDTRGNLLVLDRAGRARNSGDGPRFHSVSLYAHRRVEWPRVFQAFPGRGINVAVQADNVLNSRNYIAIGSIAGSAAFGKPLAAYPGRAVRLLFSVD